MRLRWFLIAVALVATGAISVPRAAAQAATSFITPFHTLTTLGSTVPSNGDVNPYGMAVVPRSTGHLHRGHVLISNFNAKSNFQGTGTTIVDMSPDGTQHLFAQIDAHHLPGACPGGVGLTTALVVLRAGWVIVGSLPTTDGTSATAHAGCLIVLNKNGQAVETLAGNQINGPWDMTAVDNGDDAVLFVTNVLNGTLANSPHVVNRGTVIRIRLELSEDDAPQRVATTVIGSGFSERTDPNALVIGPTGVGLGQNGTLYVADSLNNRIAAIPDALHRTTTAFAGADVSANGALNDPLGLAIAPNGDILTVNGNDGNIVETTPHGAQIATFLLDSTGNPAGAGALFGLVVKPDKGGVYYVDDVTNTLNLFH